MKKLTMILLLLFLFTPIGFGQVDHDLRVRFEKAGDNCRKAHRLVWESGDGITQNGIIMTPGQITQAKQDVEFLRLEVIALMQGVEPEPVPVMETPVEIPELAEMQATVNLRVYATGGRREQVSGDLELIRGLVAELQYEGAIRIIDGLIANLSSLFYKSSTSGRIPRDKTLVLLNQMKVRLS